jgi:hypothetical protein
MCGDGENHCGSLKAAHVRISPSDSEANAVSPFTSLDDSITSVTDVLRKVKCALASAMAPSLHDNLISRSWSLLFDNINRVIWPQYLSLLTALTLNKAKAEPHQYQYNYTV